MIGKSERIFALFVVICVGVDTSESSFLESVLLSADSEAVPHLQMDVLYYSDLQFNFSSFNLQKLGNITNVAFRHWSSPSTMVDKEEPQRAPLEPFASLIVLNFTSEANLLDTLRKLFPGNPCRPSCGWLSYYFIIWPTKLKDESKIHSDIKKKIAAEFDTQWQLDSDVYLILTMEQNTQSQIWEIYSIKNLTIIQKLSMRPEVLDWTELSRKINRRNNFHQVVLSGTAGDDSDYDWESKFVPNDTKFESGSAVGIYQFVRDALNFKELAVRGSFEPSNETLTNLEKIVWSGEADICISLLALTLKTYKYLDFLQPMTGERIVAFFVEPVSTDMRDIVISSFSPFLWATLCATLLLFVFLTKFFHYVTTSLFRFSNFYDLFEKTLANESFVWAVGIIAQQGWYKTPTSISLRIIFFFGYFTGLVVYVAFSATIASKLSVTLKYIQDFDGLLENEYDILGDKDASPYFSLFPNSLHLKDGGGQHVGTIEDGIDIILNNQTAFLSYVDVYYSKALELYNLQALSCSVVSNVPATINKVYFTMLINKKSPFTEFINAKVMYLMQNGLARRYDVTYNGGFEASCTPTKQDQRPLDVTDLFTAYMIIVSGMMASVFIFVLERAYFLRTKFNQGDSDDKDLKKSKDYACTDSVDPSLGIESQLFKILGVRHPRTLWQLHRLD